MDIRDALRSRRSIRGYKHDPVPREVLREVLELALRAPSGENLQPWEIAVITGEQLEKLGQDNVEKLHSLSKEEITSWTDSIQGVYRQRHVAIVIALFERMGIERGDKEKRAWWLARGYRFFDAPAAIILSVDKSLDSGHMINNDIGIGCITQSICLAALSHGLGTCVEGAGVSFPDIVRKYTGIPESRRIVIGIAIGYPDWDFPANSVETTREPVDKVVGWIG